jgi:hypothetical protein
MARKSGDLGMPIAPLPIFSYYNVQRFTQFGSMDCANWYGVSVKDAKKNQALYPAMGRKHIEFFGENRLIYETEPRQIFKTINFFYVVLGTRVIQVDRFYNEKLIGNVPLGSRVWFDFLPVGDLVYAMLTAESVVYVITEDGTNVTMQAVTDTNAPTRPLYVAAFGNRFVVSQKDTPTFHLTEVNLGGVFDPATAFTIEPTGTGFPLINRASGVIGQLGVLHNQLYIFTDFSTDIWANIPTNITIAGETRQFPFKLNTSYNWDYGIADPFSLSIDFGRMVWLAQNRNGLVSFMTSNGQQPQDISSQAVNVLLENSRSDEGLSPFLEGLSDGFLYQWENTVFYRVSAGPYLSFGELDITDSANAIEFNFSTQTWARVIELNGERNRIQKHIYFNNKHLVTVANDGAIYEMAGNIYRNELRTPDTGPQDINAFTKYPMRYTLVTDAIFEDDYSEFVTKYVEIDFVFGDKTFYRNEAPFLNTVFIITEDAAVDDSPIYQITEDSDPDDPTFIIAEDGNTPTFDDNHYFALFKPHIELYYSDDGGMTYLSADLREFSPLGQYQWRMRWYELATSRNRRYKLVCVSSAPIVILGGVQMVERISGGAN